MSTAAKSLTIHSRIYDYQANLCDNLDFLEKLAQIPNAAIMIDRKVYEYYHEKIDASFGRREIFFFDALEENKTLERFPGSTAGLPEIFLPNVI